VLQLELSTPDGQQLTLSQYIDVLTITVDGQALLDHVAITELEAGNLTCELPNALLDKLKASLKDNQAASADVGISLGIHAGALLPDTLTLRVVMQPELRVNVIDAAL